MLETKSEFPFPGSSAFLKPQGDPVRIIQRRTDGRFTVQRTANRFNRTARATGTFTAEAADVCERQFDAIESRAAQGRRAAASA